MLIENQNICALKFLTQGWLALESWMLSTFRDIRLCNFFFENKCSSYYRSIQSSYGIVAIHLLSLFAMINLRRS